LLQGVSQAHPGSHTRHGEEGANDWLTDGDYILEVQPYPSNLKQLPQSIARRSPHPARDVAQSSCHAEATLSNGLKIVLAERHTAP